MWSIEQCCFRPGICVEDVSDSCGKVVLFLYMWFFAACPWACDASETLFSLSLWQEEKKTSTSFFHFVLQLYFFREEQHDRAQCALSEKRLIFSLSTVNVKHCLSHTHTRTHSMANFVCWRSLSRYHGDPTDYIPRAVSLQVREIWLALRDGWDPAHASTIALQIRGECVRMLDTNPTCVCVWVERAL